MRRHLPLFLLLTLLFGSAVAAMAQAEYRTPFTGTWNLNIAKSRFNPGPPFKSFTLTFTPDGTRKLDLVFTMQTVNLQGFVALVGRERSSRDGCSGYGECDGYLEDSRQHI